MLKPVQDKSSVQNTSIICTKQNDLKSEFASIVNVPGFVIAKDINSNKTYAMRKKMLNYVEYNLQMPRG